MYTFEPLSKTVHFTNVVTLIKFVILNDANCSLISDVPLTTTLGETSDGFEFIWRHPISHELFTSLHFIQDRVYTRQFLHKNKIHIKALHRVNIKSKNFHQCTKLL